MMGFLVSKHGFDNVTSFYSISLSPSFSFLEALRFHLCMIFSVIQTSAFKKSETGTDKSAQISESAVSADEKQPLVAAITNGSQPTNCTINKDSRNFCQKCRYELCLLAGMNSNLIRKDPPNGSG